MRRDLGKYIVSILSLVMLIGFSISVLAEEPGEMKITGIGQMEGIIKPDIYQVILPTDVNDTFDFILDPQRLIEETNAIAYGGLDFEKGATVFFRRSDGQVAEDYSSSSDYVSIINKSNIPVDVLVSASVSPESLGNITMTENRTFINDTGASLYMALTDGEYTVPVGTDGAYIQTTIPAAPEEAFEYGYDQESGEYTYGLKSNQSGIVFPEYSFQLTGSVNENGNWAIVGNVAPLVIVTWKVTPSQGLDSHKVNNLDHNIVSEQKPAFSQTLETNLIGDETKEGDKKSSRQGGIMEESDSEIDEELKSDEIPDSSTTSDADSTSNGNKVQNEKKNSDISMESGKGKAPNIAKTSYTLKVGKPLSIEVDLGSGSAAATRVVSVRWKESHRDLLDTSEESDEVRYKDGKIVFSKNWINKCLAEESGKSTILTVVFDDIRTTEVEIVLNK